MLQSLSGIIALSLSDIIALSLSGIIALSLSGIIALSLSGIIALSLSGIIALSIRYFKITALQFNFRHFVSLFTFLLCLYSDCNLAYRSCYTLSDPELF